MVVIHQQPGVARTLEKNQASPGVARLITILCIGAITFLIIAFNGGIGVGGGNHVGQLPVVRRALDPHYLPGDFSIEIRQYHHRVFTYLIAACSAGLGEDGALIFLHAVGMTLLAASLWRLCRTLHLSWPGILAVGLFLAANFLWTGKGLEKNHFVDDSDIMPPTFANAFVLLAVASVLEEHYRWTALFAGLAGLFHVQIGLICAAMLAPFYLLRLKRVGMKELFGSVALFCLAAVPALLDLFQMLRQGLVHAPSAGYSLAYYIDFRHPHHFELISTAAAVWVAAHVLVQGAAYYWLRSTRRAEARPVGLLLAMSLTLVALALVHFADYYLVKNETIASIQFIRLSPLITVFGAICLIVVINVWARERVNKGGQSRALALTNAGLILIAALWGLWSATRPRAEFRLGVRRYAEQASSWTKICRWIKDYGPRGAVYLTPPGNSGFTFLSDRSNVVEFKNNPDGALYLAEWFERLRDLAGGTLPNRRGFANGPLLNQAYAALEPEQLAELGARYRAEFAVLPRSARTNFEVVYQNENYVLVKLPASSL